MGIIANVVCKTAGIAGMSAVLYDAYGVAKRHSLVGAEDMSADRFEKIVASSRTTSTESELTNAVQKKVADWRMSNPIIPIVGQIKGFFSGALSSLGDNIVPAALSSFALLGKGFWQKLGAWGLAGYGALMIAKEGFGIGKTTPVDD